MASSPDFRDRVSRQARLSRGIKSSSSPSASDNVAGSSGARRSQILRAVEHSSRLEGLTFALPAVGPSAASRGLVVLDSPPSSRNPPPVASFDGVAPPVGQSPARLSYPRARAILPLGVFAGEDDQRPPPGAETKKLRAHRSRRAPCAPTHAAVLAIKDLRLDFNGHGHVDSRSPAPSAGSPTARWSLGYRNAGNVVWNVYTGRGSSLVPW